MTSATLSYSKIQKNIQTKIEAVDLPEINWKVFCCTGLAVGLFLLVFYVWQINGLTKGHFLVNSYEKKLSELSEENKNLQVSFAESSFLGKALLKIEALNFQKTTSVKYVEIKGYGSEIASAIKAVK